MIIDMDHPLAHCVLVYRHNEVVGCVQEIDTESHTMRRFDVSDVSSFLINGGAEPPLGDPEPYDYLMFLGRPTHE